MKFLTKKILLLVLVLPFFAQGKDTKGTLSSTKLVNVEIMKVKPKRAKKIELIFRAETLDGEPAWGLKKEDMVIREDQDTCEVLSVDPISKNRPISVGLAIDHSGSMSFSWSWKNLYKIVRGQKDSIVSPLTYAKRSAVQFISSFNFEKDKISVVGFGSKVSVSVPLTQDSSKLIKTVDNLEINGSTALYDAMIAGMKNLRREKGVKVLVALTDGLENASSANWLDVVNYSRKENIPVYIVGLGSVDIDSLKIMADTTKGHFYHTDSEESLVEIYAQISKQIQSFYALEYKSLAAKSATKEEDVKISFDVKSIYLANDPTDPEVIAYLEKKEFNEQLYKYGKISIFVLLGAGLITLRYQRRKRKRLKQNPENQ